MSEEGGEGFSELVDADGGADHVGQDVEHDDGIFGGGFELLFGKDGGDQGNVVTWFHKES